MAKILSARQAGEKMGLPHKEVIRRIRRGELKAHKMGRDGWIWVIYDSDVDEAMESEWYVRTYKK
jgi:hypothetical protein